MLPMRKRVVVTGIGAISAAGSDVSGFVEALRDGRSCFSELSDSRFGGLRATHAGLIHCIAPDPDDPPEVRVLDDYIHLALGPFRQALAGAGLLGDLGPRAGVVLGTCSGGMLSIEKHYASLASGVDCLDADLLFSKRYYTAAKVLAWAAGASGPTITVTTACAAGSGAIAQGADLIRSGQVDMVVAGGADAFAPSTLAGFDALKATAVGHTTPFSKNIGLNLGEGAAFFVMENLDHAIARNGPILAELLGYGLSNDAYHPTAPDPSTKGQVAAMERALSDGGASPEVVDYVNAHGTGTRANDPIESKSIQRALGSRADTVPTSSTKSMIGHCLGGAGALEATATIAAARAGFFPPTAGFEGAREGCNLPDYVPDPGRPWNGRVALSNSFGFGGHNATLLIDTAPDNSSPITALPSPEGSVVITGIGLVTPLGLGLEPLVRGSESGVSPIDRFESPCDPFPAGLVPDIDTRRVDKRIRTRGMDLCSKYATLATWSALSHAGVKPRPGTMAEVGLVTGLATGPSTGEAEHLRRVFQNGLELDSLGAFPYVVPNSVSGNVARSMMLKGHNTVLSCGWGAGLVALVSAVMAVELGHSDAICALAADELTSRTVADGYITGLWGPGTGVVPGEGAAALMIERQEAAQERKAPLLAQVLGYGLATDADSPRTGGEGALVRALTGAIARAGVGVDRIAAVATGGGGTAGDTLEQLVLKQIFGSHQPRIASLADRLGCAEATLPLFNLSTLIATENPGAILAATFLTPEGCGGAVIVQLMENGSG
jgi:3-oxoacyl-[acyl-carrier-protein] synthase II